ncbi:iron ABC transporter substrate-binding protein [Pseudonocardia sp. WMMC193]|uniref:iron ABC transporter substrate-binding protein n=1 Tax=Pseudonocardia sp. WMMC193 TaxID=2911965 RepID=UPI001F28BA7C|nr:iron ABC transporter substrate-binding protein [Pseudonocardia sp. WMMC193]MCF7551228.1 iron ABC transporter substrate-binding protein [Pseudonocardia sp. WMMC193]
MRPRIGLAIAAFGLAALTACSSPAQQPSAAAPAGERTLIVYSGRDEELVGPLLERFEQESGIRVEARYGSTNEMAAQLQEEGEQTPAQVFLSQDAGALGVLANAGRFAPLPPDVTGAVPADYTSRDGSWVGLTGRARVVAYDSRTVTAEQAPGDIRTLVEPQWRGRVAIAPTNASFQAHVTALRVTEGEDAARAWLEGLRANDVQIHQSNGAILEAVNSGAAGIGLINHYYWTRAEGDPTAQRAQLKFGDPGSVSALVNVTGAGILGGAAGSAEALELVRYLVSPAAQTYFAEETTEYPLVAGAPQPTGAPALDQLGGPELNLSDLASLEQTVALIQSVGLI